MLPRRWGTPKAGTVLSIIDAKVAVGPAQGCNCTAQVSGHCMNRE